MITPPTPAFTSSDTTITWVIDESSTGWQFDVGGVLIAGRQNPLPPGYTPWTWDQPQPQQDGSYQANQPPNISPGTKYRYTINLINPTTFARVRWDPEMENQPPPG